MRESTRRIRITSVNSEIHVNKVAEEVGFEPTDDFHHRRFSRPVHSTTLPLLRGGRMPPLAPLFRF